MSRIKFGLLVCSLLLLSVPGCTQPPSPGGNAATATIPEDTLVARSVALTLAAQNSPSIPLSTSTPASTLTPSPTPTPSVTSTPGGPLVSVTVRTNCRSGPGSAYGVLYILEVGQTAEVVARNPDLNYWIIKDPDSPGQVCWLWGDYATVVGDTSGLVVPTAPPTSTPQPSATPPPSFQVAFSDVSNCPVTYYAINLKITNDGGLAWESDHVTLTDTVTAETQAISRNDFPRQNGCNVVSSDLKLGPGLTGYTSYVLLGNPAGHTISATVRVCSQDGEAGTCLEQTITFTP